jgi:5-methylcytosine-specific restriction endonuclease McrA
MYISKKNRALIYNKFNGRCAYSGTVLMDDWQVDHVVPIIRDWSGKRAYFSEEHTLDNMVPTQKIINHYKRSLDLEDFRNWYLGGLHKRLAKLPKSPRVERSIRKKAYLLEVAKLFGITKNKPFSGIFYFERIKDSQGG